MNAAGVKRYSEEDDNLRGENFAPLRLEGKHVILDEISPKYFHYVIEWRNNPTLNRYLNQPFKLTMELEKKWYEEVYLKDATQDFFIMVDKKTGTPFATIGNTDIDLKNKVCINGRLLLGKFKLPIFATRLLCAISTILSTGNN